MPMDKQPPQSSTTVPTAIDVERVVLARALTTKDSALDLLSQAQETLFWNYSHRLIFTAIREVVNQGGTADLTTVHNNLKAAGADASVVKFSDLTELIQFSF